MNAPTACEYAIVRFTPFVETGEFANVGVVLLSPKKGFFGFKLETRRYGRITRFFEKLDRRLYTQATKALHDELTRIDQLLKNHGFHRKGAPDDAPFAQQIFAELTRPRENIIHFDTPRVVLTSEPENKLQELFDYYVNRNFVDREYMETKLEKTIRQWLQQERLANRFRRETLGDDEYQVTFPFVREVDNRPEKVIKPLHLGHDKPSKIIDHGGQWAFRLEELKRRHLLPKDVLFTVASPQNGSYKQQEAFNHAVERLEEAGTAVIMSKDREGIIEFAKAA